MIFATVTSVSFVCLLLVFYVLRTHSPFYIDGIRKILRSFSVCMLFLVFSLVSISLYPNKAYAAATTVNYNITTDTTWNTAGSPYNFQSSYSVMSPATLTIDATDGPVIVTFPNSANLRVQSGATLQVNGNATNSVTFKHVSATAVNSWDTIYVDAGATANINYAVFNYADAGLKCRGGACAVSNSTFNVNRGGIYVYDASTLTTTSNTFSNLTYVPVALEPESTATFGTGDNADTIGASVGYDAIGIGQGGTGTSACSGDVCTISKHTFAGIENIPYVVWNYYFDANGDTLRIESGVRLKFIMANNLYVRSGGTIDINGTLGDEVIFTSERDDTVGGDTNNNAAATSPAASDWGGLDIFSGTNTIDYAKFYYAGTGVKIHNGATASLTIQDSTLQSNLNGIAVYEKASLTTARNTFNKQTVAPIELSPEHTSVTFGTGANVDILGTGPNKNGYNALGIGYVDNQSNDCIDNQCRIEQQTFAGISNIPYVSSTYYFDGSDDELIIYPGVVIKVRPSSAIYIRTGAKLDINGTQDNLVYITSDKDDTVSGDTNNDSTSTSPAAGNWAQLELMSNAAHTIDFLWLKYVTNGLYFTGTGATVQDTTISNSTYGLYFANATGPTLTRLNVENNGTLTSGEYRWGAYNNNATAKNAENIYWGSTTGPNDADNAGSCTTNTSDGNAVRDTAANPIDYCPYTATRYNSFASLSQYQSDGTTSIAVGGNATATTVVLKPYVQAFSHTGTLTVEVELRGVGTEFTNVSTHSTSFSYTGIPTQQTVTAASLTNTTSYHWQARICDSADLCSAWESYGGNDEASADFIVAVNYTPSVPSSLGPTASVDGSYGGVRTPSMTFTLSDDNAGDTVRYSIQIDNSADFSSPVVDYTSALAAQGAASFTVGQAAGTGAYTTGSEGQTLSDGSYYWRVLATDASAQSSAWSTARSGGVAFIIDGTAPTTPGTPSATTPVSSTPTWTWTASTDAGSGLSGEYYTVQWCTTLNFSGCEAQTDTVSTNSFTHTTPLDQGTWYFRVRTTDLVDNVSAYSDTGSAIVDANAPTTNASAIVARKVSAGTILSTNGWTNGLSPAFSWTAGVDNDGGSGIKGYCLYLGQDSAGNPATSKGLLGTSPVDTTGTTCQFIVSDVSIDFATLAYRGATWLTSSTSSYYFNVKAVDNANNVFAGSSAQAQFRFDNTAPANVGRLYVSTDTFSSVADMSIGWPEIAALEGATDGHSDVLGFQYQIGSTAGTWLGTASHAGLGIQYIPTTYEQPLYLTEETNGDSIDVGSNLVYFRTVDNAGNVSSSYATGNLIYGGAAPTFTTSCFETTGVVVTPNASTSNSFSLSWETALPSAGRTIENYYYMINTSPPATLSTITGNASTYISTTATSVATGLLTGAIRGSNTVYVVAKDDLDNYSSSNCLQGTFTLNSTLPDPPRNVGVSDASVKSASLWRASLAWQAPAYAGTGSLTYTVQRSTDSSTWTTIATTTGTAYVDTVDSSSVYYWRVGTSDTSTDSQASPSYATTVSLTPKGKYTTPADLSSGPTVSGITTKRATIAWTTSRSSDSKVQYGTATGSYFTEEPSVATQLTSHSINLTNLTPGTTYYYKVKWTDEDGNTGTSSEKTFSTDAAPSIQDVETSNIGLSSALIAFTSTGATKVKIYYGKTTSFGGLKEVSTSTSASDYTVSLTDLDDGTKYYYRLTAVDSEGSEYDGTILNFTTLPRPKISNVRLQEVANTAQTTILVTWETNTEISSIVTYYPEGRPELSRDEVDIKMTAGDKKMLVKALLPDTRYVLVVKGKDKIGNEAISDTQTFITSTDTRPPEVRDMKIVGGTIPPVGFAAGEVRAQLIITWNTDELSTSQVEYGEGTGTSYSQKSQEDGNLTTNHTVILSNLVPSQVYHLKGISKDTAGNIAQSSDVITIAPKATKSALDLVVGNLSDAFGFLKGVE